MLKKFAIILIITTGITFANDAVFKGNGRNLLPVRETNVQMVSELIYITYGKGLGFQVEVINTFKNWGKATDLTVGFPFKVYYPGIEEDSIGTIRKNYSPDFEVYADGIKLKTRLNYNNNYSDEYNVVYLFNLHFDPGETKILRHKYTVGGTITSTGEWDFEYILKTGALWKGNIESIAIVVEIPLVDVQKVQAVWPSERSAFKENGNVYLTWKFVNIKPDFNLTLGGFSNYFNSLAFENIADMIQTNELPVYIKGNKRYLRNLIFARFGYPFKNPFVRAQFYYNNKILKNITLKPNKDFKITDIPSKYLALVKKLNEK